MKIVFFQASSINNSSNNWAQYKKVDLLHKLMQYTAVLILKCQSLLYVKALYLVRIKCYKKYLKLYFI